MDIENSMLIILIARQVQYLIFILNSPKERRGGLKKEKKRP
jgi:hypothetical protein